jgi:hypothetical protein
VISSLLCLLRITPSTHFLSLHGVLVTDLASRHAFVLDVLSVFSLSPFDTNAPCPSFTVQKTPLFHFRRIKFTAYQRSLVRTATVAAPFGSQIIKPPHPRSSYHLTYLKLSRPFSLPSVHHLTYSLSFLCVYFVRGYTTDALPSISVDHRLASTFPPSLFSADLCYAHPTGCYLCAVS